MLAVGGFSGFSDREPRDSGRDEIEARVNSFGENADGMGKIGDAEFKRR
jgi:hypothetical protein